MIDFKISSQLHSVRKYLQKSILDLLTAVNLFNVLKTYINFSGEMTYNITIITMLLYFSVIIFQS